MKVSALKLNKLENPAVFWSLALGLIMVCFLYVYLIYQTAWNTAQRQKAERAIDVLSSETGELEFTYMAMKNNIDLSMAESLGFSPTPKITYLNRTTLGRISANKVE